MCPVLCCAVLCCSFRAASPVDQLSPRGSPLPRYGGLDQMAASSAGAPAAAPSWLSNNPGDYTSHARDTSLVPLEGGEGNHTGSNSLNTNSPGLKRSVSQPVMPLGQADTSAAALDVALGLNNANTGVRAAGTASVGGAGSGSGGRRSSPRAVHSAPRSRDDNNRGSQGSSEDSSGLESSAIGAADSTIAAAELGTHNPNGMSTPGRGPPLQPQGDASPRLSRGLSDGLSRSAAAKRRERRASEVSASASELPTRPGAAPAGSNGRSGGAGAAVGARPSRARTAQASGKNGTEVEEGRSPMWGLKKEAAPTTTTATNLRPPSLTVQTADFGGGGGVGSRASSLAAASPSLGGPGGESSNTTASSQPSRRAVNSRWLAESPTQASAAQAKSSTAAAGLAPLELANELAGEADNGSTPRSPDSGRFLDPQSIFGAAHANISGNAYANTNASASGNRSPALDAASTVATAVAKAVRAVEERMGSEITALRAENQAARAAQQRAEALADDRAQAVQALQRELAALKATVAEDGGRGGGEGDGQRGAVAGATRSEAISRGEGAAAVAEEPRTGLNATSGATPAAVAFDVPVGKSASSSRRSALEARLGMSAAERRAALQNNNNSSSSNVATKAPPASSSNSSNSRASAAPPLSPHHQQQQQQYLQQRSPHQLAQPGQPPQQLVYPADPMSGMRCATCGSQEELEPDEDNPVT